MNNKLIEQNRVIGKLKNANKINPRLKEVFIFLVHYEYYLKFGEMIQEGVKMELDEEEYKATREFYEKKREREKEKENKQIWNL